MSFKSIPLDKIVDNNINIYELTSAMIKRGNMLARPSTKNSERLAENGGKICSGAIEDILEKKVEYVTKTDE